MEITADPGGTDSLHAQGRQRRRARQLRRRRTARLHPGSRQSRLRASRRRSRASRTAIRWRSTLSPADGYGTRDEALMQRVPKRSLQGAGEIRKGMQFQARTDDGMRVFTVTARRRRHGDTRRQSSARRSDAAFRRRSRQRARGHDRGTRARPRARRRRPSPLDRRRRLSAGRRVAPSAASAGRQVLEQRQPLRQRVGLHRGAQRRVLLSRGW